METYQAVFKRKEVKYLLTEAQLAALRPVMETHMEPDAFAHSSISNLYYDTPDFRMLRRSQEKPVYKEKLRLRSYGVPDEETQVFPEIKKKAEGIVYKRRVSMSYGDAIRYLSRRRPGEDGQIFQELNWMLISYGSLAPRIFLSYERDSWKGREDPSLRLTLDREILWRTEALDLRRGAWGEPLLEPDQVLMEVKISNAAPLWLAEALSENGIFPVSFSKCGRAFETLCKNYINEMEIKRYA
nr:polyphosphate polymerase domain-containing protein [uncultured Dysosmobacter sp.]